MDLACDPIIEIKESDEVVSGGEETNKASSVEIDGEHKEKVTEEKLSDAEHVEEADGGRKRKGGGAKAGSASVAPYTSRSCKDLDDESDDCSAMRKRKAASASVTLSYEVVEEDEQIEPALEKLRKLGEGLPLLAVDLEGEHLSRKGELVILSVATEKHTYLFNIKKLGAGVFDKGLKDLLQDPDRQKLMFDCRQDSDCLWHQFNVKLTNVLDLQLMEVVHRGDTMKHDGAGTHDLKSNCLTKVTGFEECLQKYTIQDQYILQAKKLGSQFVKRQGVWLEQPLQKALLDDSAANVKGFFILYEKLDSSAVRFNNNAALEAYKNYLKFFRSRDVRTYDTFEINSYVPWRIFPTTPGKAPNETCPKCKQSFPSSDFIQLVCQICPKCYHRFPRSDFMHLRRQHTKCLKCKQGSHSSDFVESEEQRMCPVCFEVQKEVYMRK